MNKSANRYRTSRLLLACAYLACAYLLYFPAYIPSLANTGQLGFFNNLVIIVLVLMGVRQFLYLFFSVAEEIRRENLPKNFTRHPISIIVPAYNEAVVMGATIKSLLQISYPQFEILIIDDGSTDTTYETALKACAGDPRVRVIKKNNEGKSKALNFGIKEALYDFVFCMDGDSQVASDALEFGIRHFEDPEVAAVGGAVLVVNQSTYLGSFQTLEYLIGLNFYKSAQSYLGSVTVIPGPSGLFRKKVLLDVGGYKADTFAEDFDLTLRFINRAHKVVYEPYMEVRTEVPEEVIPLIKQRYRWNRGILQVLQKQLKFAFLRKSDSHGLLLFVYMTFEALVLPVLNVGVASTSLVLQFLYSDYSLFSLWLIVLVFLDLAVLLVSLIDNRWPLKLIGYLIMSRFTYALFHDIIKILSSIEELIGVRMGWGKLDRIGSVQGEAK